MKDMLYEDYGNIIIDGLCNSPKFLVNHFKREVNKLIGNGFELDEIEHDLRIVIEIFRSRIHEIYDQDLATYNRFSKEDKHLPENRRYNYPEPDIDKLSISTVKYPSGHLDNLSKLKRTFNLKDIKEVDQAVKVLFQDLQANLNDPYRISWHSNNYVEFRNKRVYFPFDCFALITTVVSLREKLVDPNVCSVDLQEYPANIFDNQELKRHSDLAAWIYNIVETWVREYGLAIHKERKTQLFDTFLETCKAKALTKVLLPTETETKTDKLKFVLAKYGFFELPKVKQLFEPNKEKLIQLLSSNEMPYCIAMFDFLGYLTHLEKEHFITKYKLNKEVAKWFNSDKEGRAVKGNISSLLDYSKENKMKYTAHKHKETVKSDYQKLK